jgi:outer membrane protein insertion porin family
VLNKSIKAVLTLLILGVFHKLKKKFLSIKEKKYILADVVLTNKISFNDQTVVTFAGLVKAKKSQFLEKKCLLKVRKTGAL